MTAPDIAAIEERLAAATPGPWEVTDANEGMLPPRPFWVVVNDAFLNPPADDHAPWIAVELHTGDRADAELIAHAPTDLAEVLAYVRRLEAREARVRELHVSDGMEPLECAGCRAECMYCQGHHGYPCATLRALDGES